MGIILKNNMVWSPKKAISDAPPLARASCSCNNKKLRASLQNQKNKKIEL